MTQRRKLEDYMKTIYLLQRSGSVRGADIAKELNVSRPTVSVSLKRLEEEGYLKKLDDRFVVLTPKGLAIAREIADRNTNIFDLLVSLGVSESVATEDACNMEHVISQESYCALIELAEHRAKSAKPDINGQTKLF